MASDTVSAALVVAGAGLPSVYRLVVTSTGRRLWGMEPEAERGVGLEIDLTDPQTAFGVALKLDAWEQAPTRQGYITWTVEVAVAFADGRPGKVRQVLEAMTARLIEIGMDAEIRRALGWGAEPGTLATLRKEGSAGWWLEHGDQREYFTGGMSSAGHDGIAGLRAEGGGYITDEAQARRAIYQALCAGGA